MPKYVIQSTQTSNSTSSLLLARNGQAMPFWPKLGVAVTLPNNKQTYRTAKITLTSPHVVVNGDGVSQTTQNLIFDGTFKIPKDVIDSDIGAFVAESMKVLAHADIQLALTKQTRVNTDITTS